jgi:hypothetical protein
MLRQTGDNNGDVLTPAGAAYAEASMQLWSFDPVESLLTFTDAAGSVHDENLRIGEWRWGYRPDGSRFIAGLKTYDSHDQPHVEIQTDATFRKRYFEIWNMGPSTWLTAANTPSQSVVNIREMVAHFSFEGDARDLTGNGNHATRVDGSFDIGHIGQCLLLDGRGDHVETRLDINPNIYREMTISAWVRPFNVDGRRQVVSSDDGGFDRSLLIQDGKWAIFNGGEMEVFDLDVVQNSWQHVVAVFSSSGTKIYLNVNYRSGRPSGTGTSTNPMWIGNNPGPWDEPFYGMIDELRIYGRALGPEEVWELYWSQ